MSGSQRIYTPGAGLPLAPPFGSTKDDTSMQVSGPGGESRGTNTPLSSSPVVPGPHGGRVGARALERIAQQLSDRDHQILERVAQHRYLTTHQIQHFLFALHASDSSASRTTRRVLARLRRDQLLRPLSRRVGGVRAGSSATIWQLASAGARVLRDTGSSHRTHEPTPRFLNHCLAVADVHLLLRSHEAIETVEGVRVQVEPASWRRYNGAGGESRWLQPDLAATIATDEYIDRWFIEVDLGTESQPTLLKKCEQYEAYRVSGSEQSTHGSFPLVLWVFTDQSRADKLRSAVARSRSLTPALYRYATPETVADVLAGGDL